MSVTITERLVSTKRHTRGYLAGQNLLSRYAAVRLARIGGLRGVKVIRRGFKYYLESTNPERPLSSLPVRIMKNK